MNNFKLGAERQFKKDYEKFREAVKVFKQKHEDFRKAVHEKIVWVKELSDNANTFSEDLENHLDDVFIFNDTVTECIYELNNLPDYPENIH